jgi:hypothetical protein
VALAVCQVVYDVVVGICEEVPRVLACVRGISEQADSVFLLVDGRAVLLLVMMRAMILL